MFQDIWAVSKATFWTLKIWNIVCSENAGYSSNADNVYTVQPVYKVRSGDKKKLWYL